jgi:hypothetical protein
VRRRKSRRGGTARDAIYFSSTLVAWRIKRGFAKSCRPRSEINKLKRKVKDLTYELKEIDLKTNS